MQIFTSLRLANCSGRGEAAFTPICDCDLEIRSRSKILFSNGSPGQNIWAHKILLRYAENSVSEVDPRFEKKKRKFGLSQPIKSTSLICVNYSLQSVIDTMSRNITIRNFGKRRYKSKENATDLPRHSRFFKEKSNKTEKNFPVFRASVHNVVAL